MAIAKPSRTIYGGYKYAAFHLLFSKWLRHFAKPGPLSYVTLGGTELRDIQSIHFVDPDLAKGAVSMEDDAKRFLVAAETAKELAAQNVSIDVRSGDVFEFTRSCDDP